MADYIPTQEAALLVWFADHAAGVATHGATVGLSAGEITQAADDAASVAHAVNGRSLYESKKQEFTAYKDILLYADLNTPLPATPAVPAVGALPAGALSACVARARQRAGQIKASPAYTTAIKSEPRPSGSGCPRNRALPAQPLPHGRGSDRVARAGDGDDPPKPVLKATVETDFAVTLKFAMQGHDLLEIQSQRAGETTWTTIGFDTASPYTDGRAPLVANQPESRRYRARFRDDDDPVGEWSDIVEVTAQG